MHEHWRLLRDAPGSGAANMARDDALAHGTLAVPTLRLYSWAAPYLSLGRLQRIADVDLAACAARGVEVVRRPSGGRAILHQHELTYCLALPLHHPLAQGTVAESYCRIGTALFAALELLGLTATPAPPGPLRPSSAACFATAAAGEPLLGGRKLLGSAQTRREGALLQHGSLPLHGSAALLAALLAAKPERLDQQMLALDEALGRPVVYGEAADAIIAAMSTTWNVTLTPGALSAAEEARATALAAHYEDSTWTSRR